MAFLQSFHIFVHCLLGISEVRCNLHWLRYFVSRTFFHHAVWLSRSLQINFPPNTKFITDGDLMPRPPFSGLWMTYFHFTRLYFFFSFLPPCHRKIWGWYPFFGGMKLELGPEKIDIGGGRRDLILEEPVTQLDWATEFPISGLSFSFFLALSPRLQSLLSLWLPAFPSNWNSPNLTCRGHQKCWQCYVSFGMKHSIHKYSFWGDLFDLLS